MQIFVFQGAIVGVIGSIIGGLLGVLIAYNLDQIILLLNPSIHLPTLISGTQIAVIVGCRCCFHSFARFTRHTEPQKLSRHRH